jgi:hypothetical protein
MSYLPDFARRKHNCPDCAHWVAKPGYELARITVNGFTYWRKGDDPGERITIDAGDSYSYIYEPVTV